MSFELWEKLKPKHKLKPNNSKEIRCEGSVIFVHEVWDFFSGSLVVHFLVSHGISASLRVPSDIQYLAQILILEYLNALDVRFCGAGEYWASVSDDWPYCNFVQQQLISH